MREPERVIARGVVAGLVGATSLAIWFLVIDTIAGRPFHTPLFLASVIAEADVRERSFGLIMMYTALHYGVFVVGGVAVTWLLSKLDAAPSLLLGLVLGFLLFDLIFYYGVGFTGVHVVQELGWPEVLSGSMLAGLSVMGALYLTMGRPSTTWIQALSDHRIIQEGIFAGLIGAVAVAAWFLIFDVISRDIFFTPGAMGSALFLGVNDPSDVQVTFFTVTGYTVVHVAAFIVAGLVAAALVVEAEQTPPLILAAILIFVSFEAFFVGLLALGAEWLLGALAWESIAVGNVIATVAMAYYLWRMHPQLQAALRENPLDKAEWQREEDPQSIKDGG